MGVNASESSSFPWRCCCWTRRGGGGDLIGEAASAAAVSAAAASAAAGFAAAADAAPEGEETRVPEFVVAVEGPAVRKGVAASPNKGDE